jgi:Iron-containing redox enzyme
MENPRGWDITDNTTDLAFDYSVEIVASRARWAFADHFEPLRPGPFARNVRRASKLADESGIEQHSFFKLAAQDRRALEFWSSQEAVTTNAFSQLLLLCCSHLSNVHARATFLPVITGEHHELRAAVATRSHPWLLKRLCESLKIDVNRISPAPCTLRFLSVLVDSVANPLSGLGALGVGNERMLVPEYTSVESAFRHCLPESDFAAFLSSNINEDIGHSALLEGLAACLIADDEGLTRYVGGARAGVTARLSYYDELELCFRRGEAASYMS